MKTYYATDSKIHPQQVQACPMNSMTFAIQIEGVEPCDFDEHGLGGYYVVWENEGETIETWFHMDAFEANYQLIQSDEKLEKAPDDKMTEVTNRIRENFGLPPKTAPISPSINTKTLLFLSLLLSALCLLSYYAQQHELTLVKQELSMCRI